MTIIRHGGHVCDPPPFENWTPPGTPYPPGTIHQCECGRRWRMTKRRGWRPLRWWRDWDWERE